MGMGWGGKSGVCRRGRGERWGGTSQSKERVRMETESKRRDTRKTSKD